MSLDWGESVLATVFQRWAKAFFLLAIPPVFSFFSLFFTLLANRALLPYLRDFQTFSPFEEFPFCFQAIGYIGFFIAFFCGIIVFVWVLSDLDNINEGVTRWVIIGQTGAALVSLAFVSNTISGMVLLVFFQAGFIGLFVFGSKLVEHFQRRAAESHFLGVAAQNAARSKRRFSSFGSE